jgi:hypothetical protein
MAAAIPDNSGGTMSESQRPTALYNISGEARAGFKLFDLRDRIRNGTLSPQDQIAIVGTDIWKPASDFPELRRYFSLLKPAAAPGAAPVTGAHAPAGSMGSRIIGGVVYPFTAITSIVVIIGAAVLRGVDPVLSIIFSILASVYALGVIRKSSEGQTTAPSAAEVGGITEWIMNFVRMIAVTFISAWPMMAASILVSTGLVRSWRSLVLLKGIAVLVMLLYYPASLATVAVWKSLKIALSIQQIFRFIGILGKHYYAVVGMWLLMAGAIRLLVAVGASVLGRSRFLISIDVAASIWVALYASHLLGWAVHLHRDEL